MGEIKSASGGVGRVYPYAAADPFNDQLADREAESGSLCSFVQFFKAVENGTLLFQWDSATGVGDGEERKFFRFLTDFQRDTSLRGELRGIDQ